MVTVEDRCATLILLVLLCLALDFFHRHAHHLDRVFDHIYELVGVNAIHVRLLLRSLFVALGILLLVGRYRVVGLVVVRVLRLGVASADSGHCFAERLRSHWVLEAVLQITLRSHFVLILAVFFIHVFLGLHLMLRLRPALLRVWVTRRSLGLVSILSVGICRGTAARSLLISRDDASFQKQTLRLVDSCSSIQSQVASRRFFDVKVKSVSPSLRRPLHFVNRCLVLLVEHIIDRILQSISLHDRSCGRSHY